MTLGQGFSFIGNQYRLELAGEEFFIDLLFFNRHLHCLVAFELKRGKFKPEYAGQLNFYLNVLDEKVAQNAFKEPSPLSQPVSPAIATPLSASATPAGWIISPAQASLHHSYCPT